MTFFRTAMITGAFLLAGALPSLAQDATAGHNMAMPGAMGAPLPEICKSTEGKGGAMAMDMSMDMDKAHADLMAGMDTTNKQMMDSMMIEDIDVAFVCSMLPHHQGAINMAKAELANGDNQWAKDMAQKVIDAQEQEIADMVAWLEVEGASE